MRKILILLGPPGVGKGTVGAAISKRRGLPLISSGDLLREAVTRENDTGRAAKEYMARGELVPDRIVASLVEERARRDDCAAGFILDGFPRTIAQAEMLEGILRDSDVAAVHLSATDDFLVRRLSGRRICEKCAAVYHLVNIPPRKAGVCDVCGGNLIQREDDREEIVRRRLAVYREKTAPLLDWYAARGVLRDVPGDGSLEDTLTQIEKVVGW